MNSELLTLKAFKRAPAVGSIAPTEPPTIAVRNVFELAADYGIQFGT
jgi:hypothetical protein